jgi:hypothetical protein
MASDNEVIAHEAAIFRLISRHRILFFSSPLWVAAILVILARFAGQNVRDVIQFMTASPLR